MCHNIIVFTVKGSLGDHKILHSKTLKIVTDHILNGSKLI